MDAPQYCSDYDAALNLLFSRINYERRDAESFRCRALNLDRMHALLELLGNPEQQLRVVHVAGTKGKGSTASMISSILSSAGYRTGLYTSPHLERLEERIAVDGQLITPDEFVQLTNLVWPAVATLDRQSSELSKRSPTFFEITTAMALVWFARQEVHSVVLEVGLGGRFDSTNVCLPRVSVITSISYDHIRQLGGTLAEIAFEKAGIIKPQIPVVSGVVGDEAEQVIERVACQRAAPLYRLGREFDFEYEPPKSVSGARPHLGRLAYCELAAAPARRFVDLELRLLGTHQAANAATAVATIQRLVDTGWCVPEEAIRTGLAHAQCPARVELVSQRPAVILDTAHNVASIDALIRTLDQSFVEKRRILIFGTTRDKDPCGMLDRLVPHFQHVILTRYLLNPRSASPDELEMLVRHAAAADAGDVWVRETPDAAWQLCRSLVGPDDLVCITGSFFLAAEMRPLVLHQLVESVQR
jgi:dihydrofolate synthase/folylpolyglutamate synthase